MIGRWGLSCAYGDIVAADRALLLDGLGMPASRTEISEADGLLLNNSAMLFLAATLFEVFRLAIRLDRTMNVHHVVRVAHRST